MGTRLPIGCNPPSTNRGFKPTFLRLLNRIAAYTNLVAVHPNFNPRAHKPPETFNANWEPEFDTRSKRTRDYRE